MFAKTLKLTPFKDINALNKSESELLYIDIDAGVERTELILNTTVNMR